MKILLYEPGAAGHRLIVLKYTIKCCERIGFKWHHAAPEVSWTPFQLVSKALAEKCEVIYILTLDGIPFFACEVALLGKLRGLKTICTYYLFTNLVNGWKSIPWRIAMATKCINRIHISDDKLKYKKISYPKQVFYLPDPWDPNDLHLLPQETARSKMEIPPEAVVFLMFGAIDERKGANIFLDSINIFSKAYPHLQVDFLLVGEMSDGVRVQFRNIFDSNKVKQKIHVFDFRIKEEDVGFYYSASDYLVCAYPQFFQVSSNTVTRAHASGRPVIVPKHWADAMGGDQYSSHLTFETGNPQSLAGALKCAAITRKWAPKNYKHLVESGLKVAETRTLDVYQEYLLKSITSI
jgi:glycosyltransferase involved in cell wall biosynthesis